MRKGWSYGEAAAAFEELRGTRSDLLQMRKDADIFPNAKFWEKAAQAVQHVPALRPHLVCRPECLLRAV